MVKNMKASEYRTKTQEELDNLVQSKKSELVQLKFKKAMGQIEKTSDLKVIRREIARVQTVAREKELSKGKHGKTN